MGPGIEGFSKGTEKHAFLYAISEKRTLPEFHNFFARVGPLLNFTYKFARVISLLRAPGILGAGGGLKAARAPRSPTRSARGSRSWALTDGHRSKDSLASLGRTSGHF